MCSSDPEDNDDQEPNDDDDDEDDDEVGKIPVYSSNINFRLVLIL